MNDLTSNQTTYIAVMPDRDPNMGHHRHVEPLPFGLWISIALPLTIVWIIVSAVFNLD